MLKTHGLAFLIATSATLLAGCGGGGSDSSGTPSPSPSPVPAATTSFPLQAGYEARIKAGSNDDFTITGPCAGTANISNGAASPIVFEGSSGFAATQSATFILTNCTPAKTVLSGTSYFDATYTPLGSTTTGAVYEKFLTAPLAFAASVKVGDTATVATFTRYADSTKAVVTGQRVLSYVVEADSANTAIVNLISKTYDTATPAQLLVTQQSRYRIAADGSLSIITIDNQFSTTNTDHYVYTKL